VWYGLYPCNLTGHVTRKTRDSVGVVFPKVQKALSRKKGGKKLAATMMHSVSTCTRDPLHPMMPLFMRVKGNRL